MPDHTAPPVPMARRLAALGAIVLPVVMLAVIIDMAISRPLHLVGALLLGGVCVAAIWIAITRRGPVRVAALLAVLAAVVAMLILLRPPWGIITLIVLLALFGALGRYALHDDGVPVDAPQLRPVGPADHPILLINPRSGDGKAARAGLADAARAQGIETVVLEPGDDLPTLARDALDRGADVIGMAGGDGSQGLVAGLAAERGVAYVCLPSGTRNHLALDLGLDRDDLIGALAAFGDGAGERVIDLAEVNGRVFVNNASLGVYAKVVQSDAYREAKARTWAEMLPDLIGPGADPIDLRLSGPEGEEVSDAPLILVSNNPYDTNTFTGAGTRPRMDTGVLGVVVVHVSGAADAAALTAAVAAGAAERFGGVQAWTTTDLTVASRAPIEIGLDGEAVVYDSPVRFRIHPQALRVRIPASAPGASPAARAVPVRSTTLNALWRTARGHHA